MRGGAREDYEKMKRDELIALCKSRGLRGYSNKKKADLMDMLVASEPKPAPAPAPAPAPKKKSEKKRPAIGTIEDYLHKMVKQWAKDRDWTEGEMTEDEWLEQIIDNGEYQDYLEDAIMDYGGHDEVGERIYKTLLKNGRTKKSLLKEMKEYQQDGYTLFDNYVGE